MDVKHNGARPFTSCFYSCVRIRNSLYWRNMDLLTSKRLASFITTLALCCIPLAAENTSFNKNISSEERQVLDSNKVLIRNVDSLKDLCLESSNEGVQKMLKTAKDLRPAYIAEIIQIRPYKGNENIKDTLESSILDIPSYAGIPY